jgi:hypothetical protein
LTWGDLGDPVADCAVDRIVVLAAEGGVVYAGDTRTRRVHADWNTDASLRCGIGHGDLSTCGP